MLCPSLSTLGERAPHSCSFSSYRGAWHSYLGDGGWTQSFIFKMQVSLEGRVLFLFLFLSLVCIRMQSRQEKSSVNLDCDGGFLRLSKCLRSNGIPVSCSENDSHSSSAFLGEVRDLNPCFYLPLCFLCSVFVFCFSPGFLRKGFSACAIL